ncbi:adenosylcobinamide-GDP ribazoletransferase [Roseovarius aestuarii]|nr:adenosylcobinamide-GDP ribazoletransferase [Roseovarius aestuarii]
MRENDTPLIHIADMPTALGLLSRLPIARLPIARQSGTRGAQAAWAYPLAGLVLAGIAGLAGIVAQWFGLPASLTALIMLALLVILTGAMHEDGLADSVDGMWGGWEPARRLEIMKDSHIGTYGVIALILSLGARWAALYGLLDAGTTVAVAAMIVAAMASRSAMPVVMWALPHARTQGLSHHVGRVAGRTALTGAAIAGCGALLLVGQTAIPALIVAGAVVFGITRLTKAKIGGQTGDILGATQQIVEISLLITFLCQS